MGELTGGVGRSGDGVDIGADGGVGFGAGFGFGGGVGIEGRGCVAVPGPTVGPGFGVVTGMEGVDSLRSFTRKVKDFSKLA